MAVSVVLPSVSDIPIPASMRHNCSDVPLSQNELKVSAAPPTPPLYGDETKDTVSEVDVASDEDRRPVEAEKVVFERSMGDSEQSYFLPSRADGVNDMCVCLVYPTSPLA